MGVLEGRDFRGVNCASNTNLLVMIVFVKCGLRFGVLFC